jgi:AcrR family transcriptional regulator
VSARRAELLERAYSHVLSHGLADMSLRPLATAIDSSPRVLLLLFGSKDGLVRALLDRARADELAMLARVRETGTPVAAEVWRWLAAPEHRPLLVLWAEAYVRSLIDPEGPWAGFARSTVEDWLEVLPTRTLAVLRGAMLDLLATGDVERTTAAVASQLSDGDA